MATQVIRELREYENGDSRIPVNGESIDMSFYTAGTGNAGATIVSATFLLLCQKALTFVNGVEIEKEPWEEKRTVNFGEKIGDKNVRLLDNPDVFTLRESLGSSNISSRFGTEPELWNLLFGGMKRFIPRSFLEDKKFCQGLAIFSLPIIRIVDSLVGSTNAMHISVKSDKNNSATFTVIHDDLEECVGLATASFAYEILKGGVKPGVFYPSDLGEKERRGILERVKGEAVLWDVTTSW